jgi:acetyl-CoA acetyltransferase
LKPSFAIRIEPLSDALEASFGPFRRMISQISSFTQCYPTMDAPALGRVIALDAGLPIDVPGLQIDRRCGSGLQAVIYAAMQVATGASEIVLAGGAESMSSAPFYSSKDRWGVEGTSIEFHDALARGRVTAGGINFRVPGGIRHRRFGPSKRQRFGNFAWPSTGCNRGRIMTTLLREMDRRQVRYGLETMCIGGGQGLAAVLERVSA